MGLGPDGELRYPSHHTPSIKKRNPIHGLGEFQCYDANMLSNLKRHAEASGNPLWGLSGPHDAPCSYDHQITPNSNGFFKEHGGSWETPYGDFFLSWYSNQLVSHGDRLLSLAASAFSDAPVKVSGKVPVVHSWYGTRSHPSELTSGFYNTAGRDGYETVAEMFAKNSCKMILPGMDLSDERLQPEEFLSSPESLLAQITTACKNYGVAVSGENSGAPNGCFEQIKKYLLGENKVVDLFTYQRMGADFFSPRNFPKFTEFVRNLHHLELLSDDMGIDEVEAAGSVSSSEQGKNLHVQSA